jgi:hypothetical protein
MSTTITDPKNLREGDYATFKYEGREFSGELVLDSFGDLLVGPADVLHSDGRLFGDIEFVSATRGPRGLPKQPSVIRARNVSNGREDYEVLILQGPDEDGDFFPFAGQDAYGFFSQIEDFEILWTLDEEAA